MVNYGDYLNEDDYDSYYEERPIPILDISLDGRGCPKQGRSHYVVTMYDFSHDSRTYTVLQSVLNKAFQVCRREISSAWFGFDSVVRRTDMVFILSKYQDPYDEDSEEMIGFALCADKGSRTAGQDNSLYIDTICTEPRQPGSTFPSGKALLNVIYNYARTYDYSYISLRAIASVVNYYRKLGFRFLKPGQTQEEEQIRFLAELNKNRMFSTASEANRNVMLERALTFAQEVDEEGMPVFNPKQFAETFKEDLSLDTLPSEEEVNQLIDSLPTHVKQSKGGNGVYDLYFALIKKGYAELQNCPGITRRQFTRSEEVRPGVWKRWITCEEGGFLMMKPLHTSIQTDEESSKPIIDCSQTQGGKRKHKTHKAKGKKHRNRKRTKSNKRRSRRHK
jgi:hypothetical protein